MSSPSIQSPPDAPVIPVNTVLPVTSVNPVIIPLAGNLVSQLPGKCLVQQRLLQLLQRRELLTVDRVDTFNRLVS